MAREWNKASLTKRIAGAAVWMIVLPAVVIAQIIRGQKKPQGK